ncbi:hypothetical protein BCT47_14170 [Vibrio splendidus]|uniref:DUF2971 domain-containing protein n=1 Tax=Vibrio splendidus TaxID=29497 RepID=UPI000C8604CA|nr:DUF2971 domain-containing protein [Vibrio splendidus]MDP2588157.1 DUF2971 domain-containing protein [Vibrio splendidus]PMM76950.1 hypothetical protein BCT47_14170 [Vibrio splendidus]
MKLQYEDYDDYIKFLSSDDALFHFTRKETALEYILFNRSLRFGEFSGTNDPQEYKSKLTGVIGSGWEKHHEPKMEEVVFLVDKLLREKSKFISFCQNDMVGDSLYSHGVLKSRMWAQYGENHRGVCIVVSKAKLIEQLTVQFELNYRVDCGKIRYEEPDLDRNIPCLKIDGTELDSLTSSDVAINFVTKHISDLLFTKQPDYKDEAEFRFVLTPKSLDLVSVPIDIDLLQCVHSVILGDAFPKVYEPTTFHLAKELKIPVKKLHWQHHAYILLN